MTPWVMSSVEFVLTHCRTALSYFTIHCVPIMVELNFEPQLKQLNPSVDDWKNQ
jgi:hypothetical protein